MDYAELRFSEIMQYKVEKRIHLELIPTSTSSDELVKLSSQRGQGRVKSTEKTDLRLLEIELQLLPPRNNLTSLELYSQLPIPSIIKVLYMRCLNLKTTRP